MKTKRLYMTLSGKQLEQSMERFHFTEHKRLWEKTYRTLLRVCEPKVYYEYGYPEPDQVTVILTLGEEIDRRLETAQKDGQFLEAYALECLSMELLSQGYEQMKSIFFREKRRLLSEMRFCTIEDMDMLLPSLSKRWGVLPIQVNEAMALVPSKSVIYYGLFEGNCTIQTHHCASCKHLDCVFRDNMEKN